MSEIHGTRTVHAGEVFIMPATDFMISPLSTNTSLHIISMVNGVEDDKNVADIKANEYTKVHGSIPGVKFYVNTTDDPFYVKW